jgi:hypothetical protein
VTRERASTEAGERRQDAGPAAEHEGRQAARDARQAQARVQVSGDHMARGVDARQTVAPRANPIERRPMRFSFFAAIMLAAGVALGPPAHADTLACPTSGGASFLTDYPSSCGMTASEELGDSITQMSGGGTTLMLPAVPRNPEGIMPAIASLVGHVAESPTALTDASGLSTGVQNCCGRFSYRWSPTRK